MTKERGEIAKGKKLNKTFPFLPRHPVNRIEMDGNFAEVNYY